MGKRRRAREAALQILYLLDTHALIYQMFHAVPPMTAPDGRPTNAVFGVTRDLLNIAEEVKPTYLLSTFDTPEPTFRNELCPDYKAHRDPPPVGHSSSWRMKAATESRVAAGDSRWGEWPTPGSSGRRWTRKR